jgi:hypothetical protein
MKKEIKPSKEKLPSEDQSKNNTVPDSIMRRDALKRIAFLALGSVTGAAVMHSCYYDDYTDYEDYSDYYGNYYSAYSNSYYDYYSIYSAYWDSK